MEKIFYVYLHIKADTGQPFYVGKGKGNRANSIHHRNNFWKNIVNKHGFDVIMLEENLTETKAFEQEAYWISRIGRNDLGLGPLVNFTDGGEGTAGLKHSDETKIKCGITNIGNKYNQGKQHRLGHKNSDEHNLRISECNSGRTFSAEHKSKLSKAKVGRTLSEEQKAKISESMKAYRAKLNQSK